MGNFEKRPVLHFSPRGGWINDPNGLTYDGKRYHLYAQHNPEDIVWGPMHWLHGDKRRPACLGGAWRRAVPG